jgi:O-antigen ligase
MTAVVDYTRELIFILVIVLYTRGISGARVLTWAFLLGGLFPALITIYQAISGSTFQFYGFGQNVAQIVVPGEIETVARPSGHVGDANFFALALIPLVPLAVYRIRFESSRWVRWFALLATFALCVATLLTYSRGGYLALAVVLFALAIAGFIRMRMLVAAVLIVVVMLPFLPSSYTDRVGSLVDIVSLAFTDEATEPAPTADDSSVSGRRGEVLAGVAMFRDHPLLGVGAHNYPEHYQEYGREIGIDRRVQRSAHSLYVEIAAETGVVGIVAFGGLVLALFMWLRRVWTSPALPDELRDFARVLAVALSGYLLASVFLHAAYPRFLWMLAAASLAVAETAYERRTRRTTARLRPIRPVVVPTALAVPGAARVWGSSAALVVVLILSLVSANLVLGRGGVTILPQRGERIEPVLVAGARMTPTPDAAATPAVVATPEATPTLVPSGDRLALVIAVTPRIAQDGCTWHAETQHNVCGIFRTFWDVNGGLEIFGYPLSEQFDLDGRTVQYFERARFNVSVSGDNAGTVALANLGVSSMVERVGVEQADRDLPRDDEDCVYEDETGHNVCGRFAYYWITYGGVDLFGYPLSESLEEDGTRMQYFQRARFEYRPGFSPERFDIVLARVGAEEMERILNPR